MNDTNKNNLLAPSVVIGLALVVASIIGGVSIKQIRASDSISVTGSAKITVTSDMGKLQGAVVRKVDTLGLNSGYSLVAKDLEVVKAFIMAKGVTAEEIIIDPVMVNESYEYTDSGSRMVGYELRQTIKVSSSDITKITAIATSMNELAAKNVFFQSYGPEYYYSKLPETRISLLGQAISDAKVRANEIAKASGDTIGSLTSASGGVVQVLAPNSVDISDYGSYDTSTIDKDITVTVRAYFSIK